MALRKATEENGKYPFSRVDELWAVWEKVTSPYRFPKSENKDRETKDILLPGCYIHQPAAVSSTSNQGLHLHNLREHFQLMPVSPRVFTPWCGHSSSTSFSANLWRKSTIKVTRYSFFLKAHKTQNAHLDRRINPLWLTIRRLT
jgi:hypothetical protein